MKDWLVMPCFAIVEEKNQGGTPVMKTQYYTAATLDGFLATEDDSLAWLFPLGDLDSSSYPAFIAEVGSSMTQAYSMNYCSDRFGYAWKREAFVSQKGAESGLAAYLSAATGKEHG